MTPYDQIFLIVRPCSFFLVITAYGPKTNLIIFDVPENMISYDIQKVETPLLFLAQRLRLRFPCSHCWGPQPEEEARCFFITGSNFEAYPADLVLGFCQTLLALVKYLCRVRKGTFFGEIRRESLAHCPTKSSAGRGKSEKSKTWRKKRQYRYEK